MAQNKSSAVMQQRAEPDDSLDDFPTVPHAGRALIEHVLAPAGLAITDTTTCWEPACNRGFLVRGLASYFKPANIYCTDIFDYGWRGMERQEDFLFHGAKAPRSIDWVISNPPFKLAQQFIEKGLRVARCGVAMLVRTSFVEGQERYSELFLPNPPTVIAQFVERVPLFKGKVRDPNEKYWDPEGKNPKTGKNTGCWKKPSTATSYCWIVWVRNMMPQPFVWIPPCRRQLERFGDYLVDDSR